MKVKESLQRKERWKNIYNRYGKNKLKCYGHGSWEREKVDGKENKYSVGRKENKYLVSGKENK